jgi:hypothetical protein
MIVVTSLAPPRIRSASSWAVTALSHDLRHTCATLLLGRGVHPKLVHHHLGHASITMTLDRYSRWIPSMRRHAAKSLDEALAKSLLLAKPPTPTSRALRFCGVCRKNREPTSGLEPLSCSLRVCGQWLLSVAGVCISRITTRFFVPSIAYYCRGLHPG